MHALLLLLFLLLLRMIISLRLCPRPAHELGAELELQDLRCATLWSRPTAAAVWKRLSAFMIQLLHTDAYSNSPQHARRFLFESDFTYINQLIIFTVWVWSQM